MVFGDHTGEPVIERQLLQSFEKTVTFLDLIQIFAVREIRQRHHISLQRIREGVAVARQHYGVDYPLATQHRIFLFGDPQTRGHQQVVVKLNGDEDDSFPEYVQLTGRARGNRLLKPVVEMFMTDLTFDSTTGLAIQYRPMVDEQSAVLLDPTRRFGEPLVEPGGYIAEALWDATNVEGGFEAAASACGVSVQEVEIANRYYDTLLALKAA